MRKRLLLFILVLMIPAAWVSAQSEPPPVLKALADLNQRLGLQLTLKDFNWRWSQDVYQDSSLGCIQSGQTVVAGQVVGYQVTLYVNNITWDYRVSGDLNTVILCSPQPTPIPTLRPTNTPPATFTPDANKPVAAIICEGSLPFRLVVGRMGRVIPNGLPNNVRAQPGSSGALAGELAAGSAFYVLDGPLCSGGLTWWYIAETSSELMGWTPEGRGAEYWLEPYYPYGTPTPTSASLGQFSLVTITPAPGVAQAVPTNPPVPPVGQAFPTNPPAPPAGQVTLPPPPPPSPTRTPMVIPTTTAIVCSSAIPPRLVIGRQGQVTPGLPNNLRQGPGSSTQYVGEIPPGGVFTVLDGPRCASGIAWWQVNYNGLIGWTPEGQGTEYWVEPIAG